MQTKQNSEKSYHLLLLSPGLAGTYKGLTPTILKQGSNQAIRFFIYSNLKRYFQGGDNSKDIGNLRTFCIGGVAGAASVFGNTPIDVVKTRMQVCVCVLTKFKIPVIQDELAQSE